MAISQPREESSRILEIHDYHELEFAAKPVLDVVEVILRRAIGDLPGLNQASPSHDDDVLDMYALDSRPKDVLELQKIITSIFGKICCNWLEGRDSHGTTMDILHMTKRYKWDAKAVLAVATFAASFGLFRLVEQLCYTNPLAKAVSDLRQVHPKKLLDSAAGTSLKPKLEALSLLIKATLDATKSVVELYEVLGNKYFAVGALEIIDRSTADIPTTVYWTIRSTIDCASQIYPLTFVGPEYLSNPWELSSTAHKLTKIRSQILEQISFCCRYIEKKKDDEILDAITRVLESSHDDNSKSLDVLFREKEGQQALFDCLQQDLVSTKVLRNKVVGLYITDLHIVAEDYLILQQMYTEKREDKSQIDCQYEIVWFPIVDNWTNEKQRQFKSLRDQMEWLAVNRPLDVSPQVTRYVRETCGFVKKPRILVMDTQGKIVHKDALNMLCIWGNQAYPFSLNKERALWQQISWNISLLAMGIDQFLPSWIQEGKHICLYGGEDIEWIRKFTKTAKQTARESGIDLELLYIGKNRARERVVKNIVNVVQQEKLSQALSWKVISYFWLRLEKICVSEPPTEEEEEKEKEKDQETLIDWAGLPTPEGLEAFLSAHTHNPVLAGVVRLLSFGSSSRGWAAIGLSSVLFEADGEVLLRAMEARDTWRRSEESYGFVTALARHYHELCNDHKHCVNMILSDTELKGICCAVCNVPMDKMVMYTCCSDRSSFGYYD